MMTLRILSRAIFTISSAASLLRPYSLLGASAASSAFATCASSTNMDIDLLFTEKGGAGLIANENFVKKMLGAVLDTKTGLFIAEFNDGDFMETNIPVEGEYFDTLDHCAIIHIGAVKNGNIAQAYQVPLMFADDPYRNQAMQCPGYGFRWIII